MGAAIGRLRWRQACLARLRSNLSCASADAASDTICPILLDLRSQHLDDEDLKWILEQLTPSISEYLQKCVNTSDNSVLSVFLLLDSNMFTASGIKYAIDFITNIHKQAHLALLRLSLSVHGLSLDSASISSISSLFYLPRLHIVQLDLDGTQLRQMQLNLLSFELAKSKICIEELRMAGNSLGNLSLQCIVDLLSSGDCHIESLSLADCGIGQQEIVAIAKALISPACTLVHLDLAGNRGRDLGARALADAIVQNKALRQLDLSRNRIGAEGAVALSSALVQDTALSWLDLRANPLSSIGVQRIVDALHVNSTLTKLFLPLAEISGECTYADIHSVISSRLERNRRMHTNKRKRELTAPGDGGESPALREQWRIFLRTRAG